MKNGKTIFDTITLFNERFFDSLLTPPLQKYALLQLTKTSYFTIVI